LEGTPCEEGDEPIPNQIYELKCVNASGGSITKLVWAQNNPPIGWKPTPVRAPVSKTYTRQTDKLLPKQGTDCTEWNKKFPTSYGYLVCGWQGAYLFKWYEERAEQVLYSSSFNEYKSTPIEGSECEVSGDTFDVSGGLLECRYVHGGDLIWMKINTIKKIFSNVQSPAGNDVCKLQNSSVPAKTGRGLGQTAGFPTVARDTFINPGINKALVIGVDFPELRGNDADLKAVNAYDKKMLNEWYSYFSNNRVSFDLTTVDRWLHAPKAAKTYSMTGTYDALSADANSQLDGITQQMIDLIPSDIDLRLYKTIYMRIPDGEITLDTDWIVRNRPFKIKEGTFNFNFFGGGRDLNLMGTEGWAYYIHESLHDAVLIGHAPGNGWPFGVMTNQSGISESLLAWEQFQLDWLPDNQIYCIDKNSLTKSTVSLTPLEREDKQTKMAVIKLSASTAIVLESHGIDKWSSFNTNNRHFPPGFYGVVAYYIDLAQAGAPQVNSDGRVITGESGNTAAFQKWAFFKKIDGEESFKADWKYRAGDENYNGYIGVLGDTFTIEGVQIKLVGAGDYETIEITKL
jgi:hypothetical protein